jgi:hypothetical protein
MIVWLMPDRIFVRRLHPFIYLLDIDKCFSLRQNEKCKSRRLNVFFQLFRLVFVDIDCGIEYSRKVDH